jgi:hypothetical protein
MKKAECESHSAFIFMLKRKSASLLSRVPEGGEQPDQDQCCHGHNAGGYFRCHCYSFLLRFGQPTCDEAGQLSEPDKPFRNSPFQRTMLLTAAGWQSYAYSALPGRLPRKCRADESWDVSGYVCAAKKKPNAFTSGFFFGSAPLAREVHFFESRTAASSPLTITVASTARPVIVSGVIVNSFLSSICRLVAEDLSVWLCISTDLRRVLLCKPD